MTACTIGTRARWGPGWARRSARSWRPLIGSRRRFRRPRSATLSQVPVRRANVADEQHAYTRECPFSYCRGPRKPYTGGPLQNLSLPLHIFSREAQREFFEFSTISFLLRQKTNPIA